MRVAHFWQILAGPCAVVCTNADAIVPTALDHKPLHSGALLSSDDLV